jgi:hypothetical protein
MSNDFSNFSRAGLESELAGLTPEQLIKIASDAAVERIRHEQEQAQALENRVKTSQQLVLNTISDIVKVSQVAALVEHGVIELDDEARGMLANHLTKASEDAAAIADAVAEGDMAEQQLVAGLIEAAAADPEAAASMISEAGDDMSAQEVLDAARDLAEVTMAEEKDDGEKTSSAAYTNAYARLQKVSSSCSELTGEIITRMAENIIAMSRG